MKIPSKLPEGVDPGVCILIYGDTNAGKTACAMTGIPRILYIKKENKDPRLVHKELRDDYAEVTDYEGFKDFDEEAKYLNELILKYEKGERPYETIFHDGLTFSMSTYKQAVEDARYNFRELLKKDAEKAKLPDLSNILDRTKKEWSDWDTIAGYMARETILLNKLSQFGLFVVSTATASQYPKWNQTVKVAPSLLGKEFPQIIHGLFDTMGYILFPFQMKTEKDVSGNIISIEKIPPRISFISKDDGFSNTYMCRANGKLLEAESKYGPIKLDLTLIANIIRGKIKL